MDAHSYFRRLTDRSLPIVVDDDRYRGTLQQRGFRVRHFDDLDFAAAQPEPLFFLITRLEYHARLMKLWERDFVSSHLALAKFDVSPDCIEYSLDQFLSVDFSDTLARRAAFYDDLLSCDLAEVATPAGTLGCRFGEAVEVANNDIDLNPGWLYSVAEFFESSIVNLEGDRSSFTLDGDFGFDGMIYLCNKPELRARWSAVLDELVALAQRGDNVIRFADNRVVRLVVGGLDRTDVLLAMTAGKERDTSATEFALGCVDFPRTQDWRFNSVMHESSLGAHVGVGMAMEIPHMDFIARGAQVRYSAAATPSPGSAS